MKPSKYIKKLAFTNITKKKQRTILSLTSVGLSVAIIFTSLTLFLNVFSLTKTPNNIYDGNYHYVFQSDQGKPLARQNAILDYELNETLEFNQQVYSLHQFEEITNASNFESPIPVIIKEGKLPENNKELLIPASLNISLDEMIHNYKVVGIYEPTHLFLQNQNGNLYTYFSNPQITSRTVYLTDSLVQRDDSLLMVTDTFNVETQNITMNESAISYDSVKNYLKDTTTLLIMFIAIAVISLLMSIISLKNVFIISDKDRKKEIGLLKSVGATPKDIKRLLQIEISILGLIGALLGILFGILISRLVLVLFIKELAITFNWSMILNPFILAISFVIGFVLMLVLGFKSYQPYIYSNAINDLKDVSYNYDPPRKRQSYISKSFSWKMFLIYNGRLKKQTKNIFQSFALLLLTTVIFFGVFLSNATYSSEIKQKDYDFRIKNEGKATVASSTNIGLTNDIYEAVDNGLIMPESLYVNRSILGQYFQFPTSALDQASLKQYKRNARVNYVEAKDENNELFSQVQSSNLIFDNRQLDYLSQYIIEGDFSTLNEGGVIVMLDKDNNVGEKLFANLKVGDKIYRSESLVSQDYDIVKAIVVLDMDDPNLPVDLNGLSRVVGYAYDYYKPMEQPYSVIDETKIVLSNKTGVAKASLAIEKAITNNEQNDHYTFENIPYMIQENRIVSFMIMSLLYPLFFLLFFISLLNINNVLIGNVHLKRGDISIMKSVGMTSTQLYKLFIFEYLEGYINASALVMAIFIPTCMLESYFKLSSAFMLGENIFATLIVSISLVDIFIVSILVALSLNKIRKIDPIENMKDVV